jgi:hypothetical protein
VVFQVTFFLMLDVRLIALRLLSGGDSIYVP